MKTKEELKTLKDLFYYCNGKPMCETDEIRAEAVKWIDSILRDDENYKQNNLRAEAYGTIEWIKHFFDITEEGLTLI